MSAWKSLAETLKPLAPGLATALGGPLAGIAVGALTKAVGAPKGSTPTVVAKAVEDALSGKQGDAEAIVKAEREFQARMQELDIDLEEVHQRDRASARKYYAANREWFSSILDCIIIFGFLGAFWFATRLMFQQPDVPQHVTLFVGTTVGALGTLAGQVVSFWRGSSRNEHKAKEGKP